MGLFDFFRKKRRNQGENVVCRQEEENVSRVEDAQERPLLQETVLSVHTDKSNASLENAIDNSEVKEITDNLLASTENLTMDAKDKLLEIGSIVEKNETAISNQIPLERRIESGENKVECRQKEERASFDSSSLSIEEDETIRKEPDVFDEVDIEKDNDKEILSIAKSSIQELNEEQRDAVSFEGKHLLVLAGAGTGKTKTIISRALYLVDKGVSPSKILILSFTRKSAYEIVSRIKSLDAKSIGITGQTFHSWCMSIIKRYPNIFECSDATCLDEEDRESAVKLLCGNKFRDKDDKRVPAGTIINVYSYSLNAKCSLSEAIRVKVYDNGSMEQTKESIERNKPVYEDIIRKYITYKKEHNYIDYDDILRTVSVGLKKNPEIAKYISSHYEHILVDEMQDTNPLQYELLSSFYDNCHLFCVGDDAQSIYGFRGADFKTIHNFTKLVKDAQSLQLSLNYRSTQEILNVSNWVLKQSSLEYDKELKSFRGHGDKPKIIHVDNDWEEAEHITDDILVSLNEKGYEYKDHLVLSRSNWGLKKVEACCLSKKIPYQIFGGTSLMQSKHVRDVMSALRIASNFKDELAWVRYLHLWKGIGDARTAKIINDLFGSSSLKDCINSLKNMQLQSEIYRTLANVDGLQTNPSKAIKKALSVMSDRLSELYKDNGWLGRKNDFKLLEEIAEDCGSIGEFVAEYVLDPKLGTYNKNAGKEDNVVTLSTIHSAKGLEAANCYIVNVSPYSYPTPRAILNGFDAVEEERRCLYVALTRAKDKLYLYRNIAATSALEGGATPKKYEGEIEKGMHFVQKKFGDEIEIINIKVEENNRVLSFIIIEDKERKVHTIDEWAFRKSYMGIEEDASSKAETHYFLNNIPSEIVNMEYLDKNIPFTSKDEKYGMIGSELDDFDFS